MEEIVRWCVNRGRWVGRGKEGVGEEVGGGIAKFWAESRCKGIYTSLNTLVFSSKELLLFGGIRPRFYRLLRREG